MFSRQWLGLVVRVGGLWLRSGLVVRVIRITCGVKRARLLSERLCIYTF